MKLKNLVYGILIVILTQSLTGCVAVMVGAAAGATGAYVYSKNYPSN